MSAARRSQGSRTRHAPPASAAARLTARGAIAILFAVSLVGILIATWFDQPWACGLVFVIGCVVASLWVRPSDTHLLVVAPPLVYFLALLIVEIVDGFTSGKFLQVAAVGIVLNLSSVLFWLLGGTILAVAILWFRGLPTAWAEFRAELNGADDEEDDQAYEPPAPGYGRQPPPAAPRRPAPGYPSQPYADQRPRRPAPAPMPPRYAPQQQQPPRGYPPRPGYPPPGGYR